MIELHIKAVKPQQRPEAQTYEIQGPGARHFGYVARTHKSFKIVDDDIYPEPKSLVFFLEFQQSFVNNTCNRYLGGPCQPRVEL